MRDITGLHSRKPHRATQQEHSGICAGERQWPPAKQQSTAANVGYFPLTVVNINAGDPSLLYRLAKALFLSKAY